MQHDTQITKADSGSTLFVFRVPVVLVAEPDEDNLYLLSLVLEAFNAVCLEASDVASLLRLARTFSPDLILSELRFFDGSGFSIAQAIRGSKDLSHIPLIAVTGDASLEDRVE